MKSIFIIKGEVAPPLPPYRGEGESLDLKSISIYKNSHASQKSSLQGYIEKETILPVVIHKSTGGRGVENILDLKSITTYKNRLAS